MFSNLIKLVIVVAEINIKHVMLSQKLHNTYKISGTVAVICIFEHPDDLIWKNSKHKSSPESKKEELSFIKFFHTSLNYEQCV